MLIKEKALEMYGKLIVPTKDEMVEVDCDFKILNNHFSSEYLTDYNAPYLSTGLFEIIQMYYVMGRIQNEPSEVDFDTLLSDEDIGVPVVSGELYRYAETLLKDSGIELSHSNIATLAKAIEIIAFEFAIYHCKEEEEHKEKVRRCKETLKFSKFIHEYFKRDKDTGHFVSFDANETNPKKQIQKVSIAYGKGKNTGRTEMPVEWFEVFLVSFLFEFERKSPIKFEVFLKEVTNQSEQFLKNYSKPSVQLSRLIGSYADKLDKVLYSIGITKSDNMRHSIIADVFGVLNIYPGRITALNRNDIALKRFNKNNADKVQKAIKRIK